eukprot:scaffold27146_cov32-Tisochrysis_lutea.AAC.2
MRARKAVRDLAHSYPIKLVTALNTVPIHANLDRNVCAAPAQRMPNALVITSANAAGARGESFVQTSIGRKKRTALKPVSVDPFHKTKAAVEQPGDWSEAAGASVAAKVASRLGDSKSRSNSARESPRSLLA